MLDNIIFDRMNLFTYAHARTHPYSSTIYQRCFSERIRKCYK